MARLARPRSMEQQVRPFLSTKNGDLTATPNPQTWQAGAYRCRSARYAALYPKHF
jgi:hypothetical protein